MRTSQIAAAAILSGALICAAATTQPAEVKKLDGVQYLPQGRTQTMWLRIPAEAGPEKRLPAILIIPGGGWGNHFGSKHVATAEMLAGWGYVVAVIDYQIVSDQARGVNYLRNMSDSFPQCLHDCKTAVRFLRHNAEKYGIDPEKIGVLGSSAGGHLAAMTAVTQAKDGLEPANDGLGNVSSAVQACVSYYGAHDWNTWGFKKGAALSDDDKQDQSRGSTVQWVDKGDPPMLVIHGDRDKTVPVAQSRALAAKLKEAGAVFEYWEVPGAGHGSCLNGKIKGEEERVRAFLDTHLNGAGKAAGAGAGRSK
jgi:acetyl esterase/lipase